MIKDRVNLVREWLKREGYSAIVIPTNDPHFSEYVAEYWKSREWVSGFTGSAGTVVITANEALLWCDSRYFVQAEIELNKTPFTHIQKIGVEGTPSVNGWIKDNIKGRVAITGTLFSVNSANEMINASIDIVPIADPFDELWEERPELPQSIVRIIEDKYTGETVEAKINRVSEYLELNERVYLSSSLDEIAWLLNIRGADVSFNPVVISYMAIYKGGVTLFVDNRKIVGIDSSVFENRCISIMEYNEFDNYLLSLKDKEVIVNYNRFDIYHYNQLISGGAIVTPESTSCGVITLLKAKKNSVELKGIEQAMINDGVALVKFYMWLESVLDSDNVVTEYNLAQKLNECRMSCSSYIGESFSPIVGYGANGAIVHYSPTKDGSEVIKSGSFLLADSGGQYEYGTTDITRTIHLSMPTERERNDYTLVLKGNISLTMAVFSVGTTGHQLDILARQHLLRNSLNYGHGTGHGIGHYLNVHEGPQSIRAEYNPIPLEQGMVISNEPGLYRKGEYGIRLENIIMVIEHSEGEFGKFLSFQTLTLYPFDLRSINVGLLTVDERHWLNRYHSMVFDKLSQYLTTEERFWLSNKTKAI